MIGGKIFATEFPEGRIEITDVDYITGGIVDFNPIANPVWATHQNVDPTDKTRHRSLDGETDND